MRQLGHDSLTTFGIGAELSEQEWRGVVRQLLAQGLLAVLSDGYGTLRITDASAEVLAGRREVRLRHEATTTRAPRSASRDKAKLPVDLPAEDAALFQSLRDWRSAVAKEQNVPAYVVFADATLRGIAAMRPATLDALSGISGVGAKKLETYGDAVLQVVAGVLAA